MELKDIITLINTVSESKLSCFTYEEGDTRLSFEINREVSVVSEPVVTACHKEIETESVEGTKDTCEVITSPMVGTFYTSSGEDTKPYIEVGDMVKKGQTIGIVEAMKLMNEIESPFDGVVEEILVQNKEMVGFNQMLVRVKTI